MIAARPPQPPVWLLDVDGVINADHPEAVWGGPPASGRVLGGNDPFLLTWSPLLIARIREIALTGAAEIQWASTWCTGAATRQLEEMWGLPELTDAFDATGPRADVGLLKYSAALDILESDRRLIWTDDDEVPHRNDPPCDLSMLAASRPSVLIAPHPETGLTPDHMRRIEAFCAEGKGI